VSTQRPGPPPARRRRLLGVPRSSMYYRPAPVFAADAMFKAVLLDLEGEWPTYGCRRLTGMMRLLGLPVHGKRVRRWTDALGINGSQPTRSRCPINNGRFRLQYPLRHLGRSPGAVAACPACCLAFHEQVPLPRHGQSGNTVVWGSVPLRNAAPSTPPDKMKFCLLENRAFLAHSAEAVRQRPNSGGTQK
jgi:putative transposase